MLLQSIAVYFDKNSRNNNKHYNYFYRHYCSKVLRASVTQAIVSMHQMEYVQCSRKGEFSKIFHLRHHFWERLIKITVIVGYIYFDHAHPRRPSTDVISLATSNQKFTLFSELKRQRKPCKFAR